MYIDYPPHDLWASIETAPKDGTVFLSRYNGELYLAAYIDGSFHNVPVGAATWSKESQHEVEPYEWHPIPLNADGLGVRLSD